MITIGVQDDDFRDKMKALLKVCKSPMVMMDKVCRPILQRDVMRHFQREEGSDGKWAPLKEATIARRRKGSHRILQDTGRLRASIGTAMDGAKPFIGTNVIYAPTHQFGRGNIPARPFLWLSEEGKGDILSNIERYIRMNLQ